MARTEYNKVQYAHQKKVNEAVKRFAELNPDHFKELQERAKYELEHPKPREVIKHTYTMQSSTPIDLDAIFFPPNVREYFCLTTNGHLFCTTAPVNAASVLISEIAKRDFAWFTSEDVAQFAQCACPACKRRDTEEGTPHDYTKTTELLDKYFARKRG